MMRGARWQEEQRTRRVMVGAWMSAALFSYPLHNKRLPPLKRLLKTERAVGPQTPLEQSALMREWAMRGSRQGLAIRIVRLDRGQSDG